MDGTQTGTTTPVNPGVMAIKEYTTLPRTVELDPYNQMQFCAIPIDGLLSDISLQQLKIACN